MEYTQAVAPEQLRDMHLIVIAESHHDLEPLLSADWENKLGSLEILFGAITEFQAATMSHLQQLERTEHPATQSKYVWIAGEGTRCKMVRRHAITNWHLSSDSVQWCPYWFLGRARP